MAASILFKIACPSCDAQIPVRDSNLVGRKVACPTCKYPFVVENPDGFEAIDEDGKAKMGRQRDDDGEKPRKAKKKANSSALKLGLGIGGIAVAVLGVGAYFMFFGDDSAKKPIAPVVNNRTTTPPANTTPPVNTAQANAAPDAKEGENKSTTPPTEPANKTPEAPAVVSAAPAAPPPTAGTSGDISNLLPNDCVSVTWMDLDKLRFCTLGEQLFEKKVGFPAGAFKTKLGIDIGEMAQFVRGENIEQKWSFNVLRTKNPIEIQTLIPVLGLKKGRNSPIQNRAYWELAPNPLLDNISVALLSPAELKERKEKKNDSPMPIGLLQIDQSTFIFSQLETLEDFMKVGCKPLQKSKPTKNANDPNQPGGEAPGAPPPKGGRGMAYHTASANMVLQEEQLTDNATFLTVDPPIKAMFDRLHNDPKNPPILTHVILPQSDQRLYARLSVVIPTPDPRRLPGNMRVVGVMLNKYELEKFYATVGVEFFNENDVKLLETFLKKNLTALGNYVGQFLGGIKVETEGGDGGGGGGGGGGGKGGGGGGSASGGVSGGLPGISIAEDGPPSKIKMVRKGRCLMGIFEMNLIQRAFDRIYGMTENVVAKIRGNVDMANPLPMWTELSKAAMKLRESEIPRGTFARDSATDGRLARHWPPQQRVSWMAGLLPHLGHDELFRSIDTKKSWREGRNLKAGATIVPEFLDPRYPDRAWYARLDSLESRDQAATHYVGIAGVGPDAGDYKADDPAVAKKLGAFSYDRVTKLSEVSDGLANTIMMIQVPPTYQRPWIAGGGATVVGVPETRSLRPFIHTHGGKRGAYVLMLDGSVRFIPEDMTDEVFKSLCTIKGGETIEDLETIAPKAKAGDRELKTTPKEE